MVQTLDERAIKLDSKFFKEVIIENMDMKLLIISFNKSRFRTTDSPKLLLCAYYMFTKYELRDVIPSVNYYCINHVNKFVICNIHVFNISTVHSTSHC